MISHHVDEQAANTTSGISGGLGSALFGGSSNTTQPSFNPFSASAAAAVPPPSSSTSEAPLAAFSTLSLDAKPTDANHSSTTTPPQVSGPETPAQTLAPPHPAYLPAQYLSTFEEYLPADPNALAADTASKVKQLTAEQAAAEQDKAGGQTKTASGAGAEQWERVLPKGVDEVFEKFLERLHRAEDGDGQVLRSVSSSSSVNKQDR